MTKIISDKADEVRAQLWGSFFAFVQVFFPLVTGRPFTISNPLGRESHFITLSRELTKVFRLETNSLLINISPGSGKSTLMCAWVAWTLSKYPDSQYLYISYGHELASKHTEFIRRIVSNSYYRDLFGVKIRSDIKAKDHFMTEQGGSIKAFSAQGSIVGQDGGLPNLERFSGAVVCDDLHKIDEVHSDTIRERVINNYRETIVQRPRGPKVPIIFIGQRLHEDDLPAFLLSGRDERIWRSVILKSIDDAGNAMYPEVNPLAQLLEKKEKNPYVFSSQFQQEPSPAGGALFRERDFAILDEEPEILLSFITCDTAETALNYNDASVFSFWGLYKIKDNGIKTDIFALHWIDCLELRVEPRELEGEFLSFYSDCMLHKCQPTLAAIEKKSTGVTLLSVLEKVRGLTLREVKRTKASGSKAARYIEMQPYIASRLVSFTYGAKHIAGCIKQMVAITANDSHRWDDRCYVAGSKIATTKGYINIENIQVGDKVITPFGVGRVSAAGCTGYREVITNSGMTGTGNHPVFTDDGFKPLDSLCDAVQLDYLSFTGLLKWKYKNLLCSMESNIDLWVREDIILVYKKNIKSEKVLKDCMWQFGNFIADKQYKKAMSFTIKMATILTTTLAIWSIFRAKNMTKSIASKGLPGLEAKKASNTSRGSETKQKNGIEAQKEESGTARMPRHAMTRYLKSAQENALCAIKNLFTERLVSQQRPVACLATLQNIEVDWETLQQAADCVEKSLQQRKGIHNPETEKRAHHYAEETIRPVYNLTVEKFGVYYVNNILVSNCDTAYDAVKIALIDKTFNTLIESSKDDAIVSKGLSQAFSDKLTARRAYY